MLTTVLVGIDEKDQFQFSISNFAILCKPFDNQFTSQLAFPGSVFSKVFGIKLHQCSNVISFVEINPF